MAALRNLVVAYDGSDQAKSALDVAIALARSERACVVVCYALDVATEIGRIAAGFHYTPPTAKKMLREDARAILGEASARVAASNWKLETKFLDVPVVSGIVDFASRIGSDMIVIGSHGRTGLPRFILGSVAEGVLRHAGVPVLVVRTPIRRTKRVKKGGSARGA